MWFEKNVLKIGMLLLMVCFTNRIQAQLDSTHYIAHYNLTHYPDDLPYSYQERMILLIGKSYVQFKSYDRFKRDSIIQKQVEQGGVLSINYSDPDIPRYSLTQQSIKALGSNHGFVSNWLIQYYYWDYVWPILEWTLHPDTMTIAGYHCQKATTISPATGWEWTVWFTSEIPISTGPQLLEGLPGLVVQAKDNQRRTQYVLEGFGVPDPSFALISLPEGAIKSTKEDFERAQALSKEDPHGYINKSGVFQGSISGLSVKDANGQELKTNQGKTQSKKGGN